MADIRTNIGGLSLKNPVMTASGTFGYGIEFADLVNLEDIGGIIVKGTTLNPREGNDYPRMAETPSGMLNCVGLQNKGVDYFCQHIYPEIKDINTNMIVNVSGSSPDDYAECASRIDALDNIPAIELNISCPNVKQGGMAFGVTTKGAYEVVKAVREAYHKTLIVKLSPNVTSITDIAKVVEDAGADAVSLINTLMGMVIDTERRKPLLSIGTGGLSGPAVKPVAVRSLYRASRPRVRGFPGLALIIVREGDAVIEHRVGVVIVHGLYPEAESLIEVLAGLLSKPVPVVLLHAALQFYRLVKVEQTGQLPVTAVAVYDDLWLTFRCL